MPKLKNNMKKYAFDFSNITNKKDINAKNNKIFERYVFNKIESAF